MGQLTAEDFSRMQREAKARVAEMQRRSRFYTERSQNEINTPNKAEKKTNQIRPDEPAASKDGTESESEVPAGPVSASGEIRREDPAETVFLLFLSFLICEEDHDLFLFLMMILLE